MIYAGADRGPLKMPGVIPPTDKRIIGPITYYPDTWEAGTVYYLRAVDDYDIVLPSYFEGFYFMVVNPGRSHPTKEPNWPTKAGQTVQDGSIVWQAVPYNLLPVGVTLTDSIWIPSDGVVIAFPSLVQGRTQALIDTIPTGVTTFTVANQVSPSSGAKITSTFQYTVGVH